MPMYMGIKSRMMIEIHVRRTGRSAARTASGVNAVRIPPATDAIRWVRPERIKLGAARWRACFAPART